MKRTLSYLFFVTFCFICIPLSAQKYYGYTDKFTNNQNTNILIYEFPDVAYKYPHNAKSYHLSGKVKFVKETWTKITDNDSKIYFGTGDDMLEFSEEGAINKMTRLTSNSYYNWSFIYNKKGLNLDEIFHDSLRNTFEKTVYLYDSFNNDQLIGIEKFKLKDNNWKRSYEEKYFYDAPDFVGKITARYFPIERRDSSEDGFNTVYTTRIEYENGIISRSVLKDSRGRFLKETKTFFDSKENLISSITYEDKIGNPKRPEVDSSATTFSYNKDGFLVSKAEKFLNKKPHYMDNTDEFVYDKRNRLVLYKDGRGNETHYTYDKFDNIVKEEKKTFSDGKLYSTRITERNYTYDKKGNYVKCEYTVDGEKVGYYEREITYY